MTGDAKIWAPQQADCDARDRWWAEVVAECQRRGYAPWFYADRAAWLEMYGTHTPIEAIEENVEAML